MVSCLLQSDHVSQSPDHMRDHVRLSPDHMRDHVRQSADHVRQETLMRVATLLCRVKCRLM